MNYGLHQGRFVMVFLLLSHFEHTRWMLQQQVLLGRLRSILFARRFFGLLGQNVLDLACLFVLSFAEWRNFKGADLNVF